MKKILSIALVLLMAVALVTGCNSSQPASTSGNAPAGNEPAGNAPASNEPAGNAPAGNEPAGNAPAGNEPAGSAPAASGVPVLNADATKRAQEAYAFIDDLHQKAAGYDPMAAKYHYRLNTHEPATSAPSVMCYAWSDAVLAATDGDVYIEIGPSNAFCAGGTMEALNELIAGSFEFVFTLPCYFKNYMPLSLVMQNPALMTPNITVGAYAMWELYKNSPEIQKEYANNGETLFLWVNNPSPLSYKGNAEISDVSQIKGNIRGNNGPAQMFIEEVGADIYSCGITDVYTNVSTGVIDYLITDWHGIYSFNLYDTGVLNNYLDVNIGCSDFLLMGNDAAWAEIVKNGYGDTIKSVSGDYLLNLVGIFEDFEAKGRSSAIDNGGTIYLPSAALQAQLDTAYKNVAQRWISENGPSAQGIYDQAAALVKEYSAMYKSLTD